MVDKIYLKKHMSHREELKNEQERYALLESRCNPKSKQMDGMPHAASGSRDAGYTNDTFEKMEVENKIAELNKVIKEEYLIINQVIERLEDPDEKMILKMRYFHCMEWFDIRDVMYSKRKDYHENLDKYKDKTFRIHGAAIKHLKKIQEAEEK